MPLVGPPFGLQASSSHQCTDMLFQVIPTIIKEFGLGQNGREKMAMGVEDVAPTAQSTWATTDVSFKGRRQRIATLLFEIGAFIAANRPQALLKLRYRHIIVARLRDPISSSTLRCC
jgi:hypothetical protein